MNRLDSTCLASFSSKRLDKIRALAGPKACTPLDKWKYLTSFVDP